MISSVLKALDILALFSPAETRLTLGEICERCHFPKSTAHNLLQTLLSRGFVEKVGNEYALGTALLALSQAVRINAEVRDRAAPLLRELADQMHESVYLAVLDGEYALYVYAVESPRRLLARTAVGDRVELHCTSLGKAILASLPDQRRQAILDRIGLPAYTDATIVDADALRIELEKTKERGYAIDVGEHEAGTYCIGAAILDHGGRVIGACSVSGADPEIVSSRREQFSTHVKHVAQEISRRMGYVPPRPSLVAGPYRSA
jgi:IclR family acetate operon transcriptional repressor